ncbi:MAG TPA: hypothetical protein PKD90_03205 [Phnomibacter sp.]|nr:hypothetical protein [Phnomibacter sp.]
MKYLKLMLLSIMVFYLLFWAFTFIFPRSTVISRAANMGLAADTLAKALSADTAWLTSLLAMQPQNPPKVKLAAQPFYPNDLYNMQAAPTLKADTVFFEASAAGQTVQGGFAFYPMAADSSTAQLYLVFTTPWYKPWQKMYMMMADKKYGPTLDEILKKLKAQTIKP